MRYRLILPVIGMLILSVPGQMWAQFGSQATDAPPIARRTIQKPIETMLLGVYHFDNPGMDEMNTEVDDYFTEKRQREIQEVVAKLVQFKPTKIFVETVPGNQALIDKRFRAYANEDLKLTDLKSGRNEIYQLGFRIAKACKLKGVVCIDSPGIWLGQQMKQTGATVMPNFFAETKKKMESDFEKEASRMAGQTILENLVQFNTKASIMENHSYYNQMATLVANPEKSARIPIGKKEVEGESYFMVGTSQRNIGAELVGKWYTRNIKIFSNIIREIEDDDERVLVIIGQGHIRPIQHFCEDHPALKLVPPNSYLQDKGANPADEKASAKKR